MNPEELKRIGSEKAKEQMQSRFDQQQAHIEERFGKMREKISAMAETEQNFAVLNFVLTLHDFSHLKGMDLMSTIQRYMVTHYNGFEDKVRKMEAALGSEAMERLGIDTDMLYPTDYCTRGLQEIAQAARDRARAGKYLKLEKPKTIIL